MALSGEEANVMIALPREVCDRLAKAFPHCPIDDLSEADSLQLMVVTLLEESQRGRRNGGEQPKATRGRIPDIHGGPEGSYERDVSTGRWRSVSCTRRSAVGAGISADATSNVDKENQKPDDLARGVCSDGNTVHALKPDTKTENTETSEKSPTHDEELDAAHAAAKRARAEIEKLWDAAETVVSEPEVLAELRRRDALASSRAEAEFEVQRKVSTWDMMRSNLDMKTFTEVARKADSGGSAKEDRNVSVGAARRIFDAPSTSERPERGDFTAPPKKRLEGSRPPAGRGGGSERASSREPTSLTSTKDAVGRSHSRSFMMPPRSKTQGCDGGGVSSNRTRASLPATFAALQASSGSGKSPSAEGTASARQQSASVRSLIQALDGVHGGARGGA